MHITQSKTIWGRFCCMTVFNVSPSFGWLNTIYALLQAINNLTVHRLHTEVYMWIFTVEGMLLIWTVVGRQEAYGEARRRRAVRGCGSPWMGPERTGCAAMGCLVTAGTGPQPSWPDIAPSQILWHTSPVNTLHSYVASSDYQKMGTLYCYWTLWFLICILKLNSKYIWSTMS